MHNIQCHTNCFVTIEVKSGLQFLRRNAPFKGANCMLCLSHILVVLEMSFRDWKPAKNTFTWNISDIYANIEKFSDRFRK